MVNEQILSLLSEVSNMHQTAEKLAQQTKYTSPTNTHVVNSSSFFNSSKQASGLEDAYAKNLSLLAELKTYIHEFTALDQPAYRVATTA
jgi:hypothetical protein